MVIDVAHLIQQGDFCEIVSTEFKDDGLKRGNYVFVAGQRAFPISEDDMYTQRIVFMCHKCNRKGVLDMEAGFFLIDPASLMKLPEDKQEKLYAGFEAQIEHARLITEDSPSEMDH